MNAMSHWRDLLMLNKLRTPVGNMRIFIRIQIRILHVVQSADPQSADPHYTRSHNNMPACKWVPAALSRISPRFGLVLV